VGVVFLDEPSIIRFLGWGWFRGGFRGDGGASSGARPGGKICLVPARCEITCQTQPGDDDNQRCRGEGSARGRARDVAVRRALEVALAILSVLRIATSGWEEH